MPLPAALLDRARRARIGLEVAAGVDWSTSLELARAAPQAEWWVSDVDPRVMGAPAPLRATLLDLTRPHGRPHGLDAGGHVVDHAAPQADLVFGTRLPEELQVPAWRLARALGADLFVRALKDEWADLPGARVVGGGWRVVASSTT